MKAVSLGDAADFINGVAFKPEDWGDEGSKIIRIQNLNDKTKPYNRTTRTVDNKYIVQTGDILVSWSASLGVFEWKDEPALLNQHIFRVVPHNNAEKTYLKYALVKALDDMQHHLHGATMQHVNRGEFLGTKIYLPPLDEQKRIAAILDKADAIRRKRAESIRLLDDLLRATFLDMFGDPLTNPKGWKVENLGNICSKITDGVHAKPIYVDQGIPFISVKNITKGYLDFDNCKYISQQDHDNFFRRCNSEHLDILYTKVGATYGRPAIVDTKNVFSLYVSVALLKPNKDIVNPYFLKEALANPAIKRQADKAVKGAGVPDLHLVEIKKFKIPLPPIDVQNHFVERVESINRKIINHKSYLKESDTLFHSLVARAFKGEL